MKKKKSKAEQQCHLTYTTCHPAGPQVTGAPAHRFRVDLGRVYCESYIPRPHPFSPFIVYIALSLSMFSSSQCFPVPYFKGSSAVVFLASLGQEASLPILPPPATFRSLQEALVSLFCLLHLGGQSSLHYRIVVPVVVLGASPIDLMLLCGRNCTQF